MFEWLSAFKQVLVTGPQRSGTRIAAKMIAFDTGFDFIDEDEIGWDGFYRIVDFLGGERRVVIQCPALCRYAHMFRGNHLAVVLMRREVEDIIASQKRIGWIWEWLELARYDLKEGVIAEVKYQFWDQYQKTIITHPFEIEYQRLIDHPLWVNKESRQNFLPRQTAQNNKLLMIDQYARPLPCTNILYLGELPHETVIINKVKNCARSLNEVGQFVWRLCDGRHTRKDLLLALEEEFDNTQPDILAADLDKFLSDLIIGEYLRLEV